jgi:hypothetical protein
MIYWSQPFDLVFIGFMNKSYYLIADQSIYESTSIKKLVNPSDRCPDVNELFNQTIVELDLIRRIKSYHLLCRMSLPDLDCFYDEVHFCLC